MDKPRITLLTDERIEPELVAIIRNARSDVVLVTPYIHLWGHVVDAISLALKRGVNIAVVVRHEDEVLGTRDVVWLMEHGVEVLAVEGLHAKIYMNEGTVIVSSMNLTESSTKNSREVALVVGDDAVAQKIRQYIRENVVPLAQSLNSLVAEVAARSVPQPASPGSLLGGGYCIRCGGRIVFDPDKPLCAGDYETWAEWRNDTYAENFCHSCGRQAETTYAKPLCRECYRRLS